MTVKELIKQLQKIEDKERNIQVLIGNEEFDSLGCESFTLLHVDDNDQCLELFCDINDCYTHPFPDTQITINR